MLLLLEKAGSECVSVCFELRVRVRGAGVSEKASARRRARGARESEEVGEAAAVMIAARSRMANCQTVAVRENLISFSPFSSLWELDSKLSRFTIPCRGQQDV